jgi:DNA-directed RNA polymerase subunit RPC12/RpoP
MFYHAAMELARKIDPSYRCIICSKSVTSRHLNQWLRDDKKKSRDEKSMFVFRDD